MLASLAGNGVKPASWVLSSAACGSNCRRRRLKKSRSAVKALKATDQQVGYRAERDGQGWLQRPALHGELHSSWRWRVLHMLRGVQHVVPGREAFPGTTLVCRCRNRCPVGIGSSSGGLTWRRATTVLATRTLRSTASTCYFSRGSCQLASRLHRKCGDSPSHGSDRVPGRSPAEAALACHDATCEVMRNE